MIRNLGKVERGIRLVLGVLILGLYGALEPPLQYLTLIGLIPLGSALTGFCPFYAWRARNRSPAEARRGET